MPRSFCQKQKDNASNGQFRSRLDDLDILRHFFIFHLTLNFGSLDPNQTVPDQSCSLS